MPQPSIEGEKKGVLTKLIIGVVLVLVVAGGLVYYFLAFFKGSSSSIYQSGVELKEVKVQKITSQTSDYAWQVGSSTMASRVKITNFENNEKWQGGGVYDTSVYYEGSQSLSLVSVDRKEIKTYLKKDLDLSNMEYAEFMININDKNAIENIYLEFGDLEMNNYYSYNLSNLENGWNFVQIPKKQFVATLDGKTSFDWDKIKKVQLRANSRVDSMLIARVDMLRGIVNSDNFIKNWKVYNDLEKKTFSLYQVGDRDGLVVRNLGSSRAVLNDVKNAKNFIYSASISPQSNSLSGLFIRGNYTNGYGYYFLIGGVRENTWQITKLGNKGWLTASDVIRGTIGNEVFQNDKEYWLRVEANSSDMKFYLSFDGDKYYQLGELKDSEFTSGGIGVAVLSNLGWSVFNDFMYKKL